MTKELDDFFHKQNTEIAIREFADELCGSDKQAAAFTASCSRFFELNSGGGLFFKMPSGEKVSAIRDPRVKEFFKSEYPFFMPPPKEAAAEFHGRTVEVDPAVVASALAGNLTAKGKVARAFGDDVSAADLFLKAEAKKASGGKGDDADNPHHDLSGTSGSNPWSAGSWSITNQGKLVKALGEQKAAAIAKAAGSFIGATKPAKVA